MPPETGEEAASSAPTFRGRLQLQEFMFNGAPGEVRRSPRHATPLTGIPRPFKASRQASASSSPSKRRAPSVDTDSATPSSPAPSDASSQRRKKAKAGKKSSGYAPPSTYAHLPLLPDAVGPNLLVFFVGLNPGIETAKQGHSYAHPTNLFWRLLHSSGITPRLCSPMEDRELPALYSLGQTNIVARPSRNGAELSKAEMDAGVWLLEEKARRFRPEVMCLVGKSIWESIWRVRHGRGIKPAEFRYGWQDESENMGVVGEEGQKESEKVDGVDYGVGAWSGAKVFVASSTSGLAATLKPAEKERIWRELGVWVEMRRAERAAAEQ